MLSAAFYGPPGAAASLPPFCLGSNEAVVDGALTGKSIRGVSLVLEQNRLHAGETLRVRLVNHGEERASYGEERRLERYSGSGWVFDPTGPDGPWFKRLWGLGPGRVGRCFEWVVPEDQSAGTYRFVVPAKVNGTRAARVIAFTVS